MRTLEGKVAIVTGAGRYLGIGRHIALALARHGADVVITGSGRSPDSYPAEEKEIGWRDIESVAEEIRALGRNALPLVASAASTADCQRLVDATRSQFGHIDILVNNAAAGRGHDRVPLVQLEESEWRRVLDVNLTGMFLVTKHVGKIMIEQGQGGSIVNISSILGRQGVAMQGAYSVTKAGAILFTQVLAMEMAPHKINVNCICPGLIATDRVKDMMQPGAIRDAVLNTIPLRRAGEPQEIGEVAAFLAGPSAAYIQGQTLNVDGGRFMS
jgi:NAD(P)-dependent dehydrogenase (short-subunit alcohol dehydrogenase family)